MKKLLLPAAVVTGAALLLAVWLLWGRPFVVELDQSELQTALEKGFPVEKTYLLVLKVDLRDPKVTLEERSDRISLAASVRAGFLDTNVSVRGTAEVSCRIRYEADRGAFFADDPKVERLTIEGHPKAHLERTKSAITWILKGVLDRTPIYKLRDSDSRQSIAKLILKDARVKNGKLRLTLEVGKGATSP